LTTIDFGQLTNVGGELNLSNNNLTVIDFGQLKTIAGILTLYNNRLSRVNCTGITIAGCLMIDHDVALINCPAKCTIAHFFP